MTVRSNEPSHAEGAREAINAVGGLFSGFSVAMQGDWSAQLGVGKTTALDTLTRIPPFGEFRQMKVMTVGFALGELTLERPGSVLAATLTTGMNGGKYAVFIGETPEHTGNLTLHGVTESHLALAYEADGTQRLVYGQHISKVGLHGDIVNGRQLPHIGTMPPPPSALVTNTMLFLR